MLVVLPLLALIWNRWLHHMLCCVSAIHIDASTHLGAPMFMLLSALLWLEKAWIVSPCPWTWCWFLLTLFCRESVLQSIAVYFCFSYFLCHHDQNPETQIFQSSDHNCQGNMLVRAPVTWARWWRPGRVETCRLGEEEMSLNSFCLSPLSSAGCSGFADCLLTLPQLLTFPVDHERDGVELALLREAVDLRLTLYKQCLERKDKSTKVTSSVRTLTLCCLAGF